MTDPKLGANGQNSSNQALIAQILKLTAIAQIPKSSANRTNPQIKCKSHESPNQVQIAQIHKSSTNRTNLRINCKSHKSQNQVQIAQIQMQCYANHVIKIITNQIYCNSRAFNGRTSDIDYSSVMNIAVKRSFNNRSFK